MEKRGGVGGGGGSIPAHCAGPSADLGLNGEERDGETHSSCDPSCQQHNVGVMETETQCWCHGN